MGVLGAERAERSAPVHTSYFPHTSYKSVATRHVPRTTPAPNNPPPAASPPPPPVGEVEKRSVACSLWLVDFARSRWDTCSLHPASNKAPSLGGGLGWGFWELKRPNAQRRCLLLPTSYLLPPTTHLLQTHHHPPRTTHYASRTAPNHPPPACGHLPQGEVSRSATGPSPAPAVLWALDSSPRRSAAGLVGTT